MPNAEFPCRTPPRTGSSRSDSERSTSVRPTTQTDRTLLWLKTAMPLSSVKNDCPTNSTEHKKQMCSKPKKGSVETPSYISLLQLIPSLRLKNKKRTPLANLSFAFNFRQSVSGQTDKPSPQFESGLRSVRSRKSSLLSESCNLIMKNLHAQLKNLTDIMES